MSICNTKITSTFVFPRSRSKEGDDIEKLTHKQVQSDFKVCFVFLLLTLFVSVPQKHDRELTGSLTSKVVVAADARYSSSLSLSLLLLLLLFRSTMYSKLELMVSWESSQKIE